MTNPISNLEALLGSLEPALHPGVYVYCVIPHGADLSALSPVATVSESEGLTLVLPEEQALKAGLSVLFRAAWITLTVHSDLQAVGLTAAFATALGQAGISCNVVAGAFHDHIFVPVEQADRALAVLKALQQESALGSRYDEGSMSRLELRVPPLAVGAAFAAAMYGLARLLPQLSFVVPHRPALAFALAAIGALVALAGVVAFRRQHTTVNPLNPAASSSIVTSGIYRVSRNPMYLGFLLVLAAWALYLSNAASALLLPGFVLYMSRFQIGPEEKILAAKFGAPFAHYMSQVRRWV